QTARERSPISQVNADGRNWREIDPAADSEPAPLPFAEPTGQQLPAMSSQTPADFFHLMFTDDLLDMIIEETNRYAQARIETLEEEGQLGPRSRFNKWRPLTRSELWGFLAIILNMGIIHLPDIESYWKTSWVCQVP
ncbi:PiggyBac transposable element-derived protein 4, partial [Geodia barretti]